MDGVKCFINNNGRVFGFGEEIDRGSEMLGGVTASYSSQAALTSPVGFIKAKRPQGRVNRVVVVV